MEYWLWESLLVIIKEIADYSYVDKMKADAINLLTAYAARGQSVVNSREVLAELRRIGYPIRFNGLMQILQNEPIVKSIDGERIELSLLNKDRFKTPADAEQEEKDIHIPNNSEGVYESSFRSSFYDCHRSTK